MTDTQNQLMHPKTTTALAPMSIKDTVIAQFKEAETEIASLADRYRNVVYDVTTPKGMKEAIAARADLRDNGRLLVTRAEKRIKADVNELKKVMSDEVERLVSIVKPVEDAVDAQIKVEEQRKAAEKAERERIEAERIAKHQENIDKLKSYVARAQGQPIEAIERAIEALDRLEFGEGWEEFLAQAEATRDNTVAELRKMVDSEKQRLENERLARELAEARAALAAREKAEAAAAAAEQEKVDAEERERKARELQAQQQAQADAKAIADAQAQADAAEAARLQAEADAQAERVENERLQQELNEARAAAAQAKAEEQEAAPATHSTTVHAPAAAPAAAPVQTTVQSEASAAGPDFAGMSEDDFKALVSNGGTLTIGEINARLKLMTIDAAKVAEHGITTRKHRGAVHIQASDFVLLCDKLSAHAIAVRNQYAA